MHDPTSSRELQEFLLQTDVGRAALRRDPSGSTWLPTHLWRYVESDADARRVLAGFVTAELQAFEQSDLGVDPYFTARVVRALPEALGDGIEGARRRVAILAVSHGLAAATAYWMVWGFASDPVRGFVMQAEGWIAGSGADGIGMWMIAVAALTAMVAFLTPRAHTPAA